MRVIGACKNTRTVFEVCRAAACRQPITFVWVEPCGVHAQRVDVHIKCAAGHSQLSISKRTFERVDIEESA